jgi:hypothetical protein
MLGAGVATVVLAAIAVGAVAMRSDPPRWVAGSAQMPVVDDDERGPSPLPQPTTGARPLGERIAVADLGVTVFAYRQPSRAAGKAPAQRGYEWAALEAEVCVQGGDALPGSWDPWSLVFEDGSTVASQRPGGSGGSGGSGEKPAFPNDGKPIPAGRCTRGWVMFAVPKGYRPAVVEYQPRNAVANWMVSP